MIEYQIKVIVWMVFKIYLHFVVYWYDYNFFTNNYFSLISISKWKFLTILFFGFWTTLFQVLFAKKPFLPSSTFANEKLSNLSKYSYKTALSSKLHIEFYLHFHQVSHSTINFDKYLNSTRCSQIIVNNFNVDILDQNSTQTNDQQEFILSSI
jgi:hypothetical protein